MVSSLWLKLRNLKIILWFDVTTGVVLVRQVFGQVGTLQNRHLLPAGGIAKTNQTKVWVTGILVSVGPNWAQGTFVNFEGGSAQSLFQDRPKNSWQIV